ncbi:MAG: hypothetical protein R3236_01360 [Phycisphaeraceae bacterium]|nr:hypothetical protein [Phycisphaeraceae bacterium]
MIQRRFGIGLGLILAWGLCTHPTLSLSRVVVAQLGQNISDKMGFQWDVNQYGAIGSGTNGCFSNAMLMSVNGNNMGFGNVQQKQAAGSGGPTFVMQANHGGFQIQRQVKIDTKNSCARFFDSFTNNSKQPRNLTVVYRARLQEQCAQIQTDQGSVNPTALGKDETTVVAVRRPGSNRPSVYFSLAKPRAKLKPAIHNNSNYELRFTYVMLVPAQKTVSLLQVLAQRNIAGMPTDAQMAKAIKPFQTYRFLRDLKSAQRSTLLNWRGASLAMGQGQVNLTELFGFETEKTDVLASGEESRLRGRAACGKLTVETRFGKCQVPFSQVLAMSGQRFKPAPMRLFLKDGQVFHGHLTAEGLRFTMTSGLSFDLNLQTMDRLMVRTRKNGANPNSEQTALLETLDGFRVAVEADPKTRLIAITPWGRLDVPMDSVYRIGSTEEGLPGHIIELNNGSRFFGHLMSVSMRFKTRLFGTQTFDLSKLQNYQGPQRLSDRKERLQETDRPHLRLIGGSILDGRVDLERFEFIVDSGRIPVPSNQIRRMHNVSLEENEAAENNNTRFRAELWDGSVLVGRLVQKQVPVRVGPSLWQIPLSDIQEIQVPTPVVSEATRQKIAQWIGNLGHPEWRKRVEATEALRQLDLLAQGQLQQALRMAKDPEVRRRIEQLLQEINP